MQNSKDYKVKEHMPLKLLKNRSYPTYQLYGTIRNKTNSEQSMVIAVLETMSWLRKRFRDLEIPAEINFPEPDNFESVSLDDFKSFRINEGYVVDVVFIKEKGIWAFHLIEPDLGPEPGNENQRRKPVPGRIFETNIAYKIYNNRLECGFKTVCSEPIDTKVKSEVFRLAVVKSIINNPNLGLEQVLPIVREPFRINSNDRVDRIIDYIYNNSRQLPFVLIVEFKKDISIDKLNIESSRFDVQSLVNRSIEELLAATAIDNVAEEIENSFEDKLMILAWSKMAYAQFGYIPYNFIDYFNDKIHNCKLSNGDIIVFYPERFKTKWKKYNYGVIKNEDEFLNELDNELQEYPKYKVIDFGNVKFFNEARIEELQSIIDLSNSKEEFVVAYEDKIKSILYEHNMIVSELKSSIEDKDAKIERLKEQIKEFEVKNNGWQKQIDILNNSKDEEIKKLNNKISRMNHLLDRPTKTENIPEWVEKQFNDKLIFHNRAIDEISKTPTNEVDMDLLCDAIEYLANEYRDERIGLISEQESNDICSDWYNRCFKATPTGDKSIEYYSKKYKVKYGKGQTGKSKEVLLDQHLKVGNDSKNMLRIYFFYDNEKNLVVVGSLPKHLNSVHKKKT